MKHLYIFSMISLFALLGNTQVIGQNRLDEIKHFFEERDNYFEENYFSKGVDPLDMSGTGYYPYLRGKYFYESRADHNGIVPFVKRWEIFQKSRLNVLNKSGQVLTADWLQVGPQLNTWGGAMISIDFDPIDPNIIYAGASEGGLWKTTDLGLNWIALTDDIPAIGVSSIAVNPQDASMILIGTGEGKAPGHPFFKPGIGVLKSTNGGNTWDQTSFIFNTTLGVSTFDLAWDPLDANNVYLAASNGLWVSRDNGENWTQKINGICTTIALNKTSPNIIYTIMQGNGVYKSVDSGENWTILANGLPTGGSIAYSELTISDGSPNVLYASIVNSANFSNLGLYKTTNAGSSWTTVNKASDYNCQSFNQNNCQGWYNNVVAVSHTNTDLIIAGGVTLWRSDNSGSNWTRHDAGQTFTSENNDGKPFIDQLKVKFSPHNSNIIVSASDGGIAISTDGGVFWNHRNNGLITAKYYGIASSVTDPNFIIGGLQDHGLYAQDNSGGNLTATRWGFSDGTRVNINHQNDNIIYGDYIFGRHLKNTNRGATTTGSSFKDNGITEAGQVFTTTTIMDPIDPEILYYCSTQKIYKTINGANLWVAKANIANVRELEIDKVDNNHIYAAVWGDTGGFSFYHSSDAGESWAQTNNNPSWRVTDIESDPFTEGTIYVTRNSSFVNNPHVLKSVDYGDNWQDITNDLPDIGTNAIVVNPLNNNYLYVATDLGVYASENGGQNWVEYNDGMPVTFSLDLNYNLIDRTLRVGTFGRGIWKTSAIPDVILGVPSIDDGLSSVSVYPNPTDGPVNLGVNLINPSNLSVKLYTINGQLINILYDDFLNNSNHQISLINDDKDLKISSGVYFIKITINEKSITKKLVVK